MRASSPFMMPAAASGPRMGWKMPEMRSMMTEATVFSPWGSSSALAPLEKLPASRTAS